MLKRLQWKASFFVLFAERMFTLIPSSVSYAGVGCIRDVMAIEIN